MRLRPSASFATGSCATTTTSESTAQMIPTPFSLTCAWFFAKGGSSSTHTAMLAAMKTALIAENPTKTRSRKTCA